MDRAATKVYKKKTATKKKKKKLPSIKSFFPTLKNSQGFGMHLCRYEEKIGDHVYEPKDYGQFSKHLKPEFCIWCKLKPCITVEHLESIQHFLFQEHRKHDEAKEAGKKVRNATPVHRAERYMVSLMTRYFGREYTKERGVPNCCMQEAWRYNCEWIEEKKKEEEEKREEEEEFGSDEGADEKEESTRDLDEDEEEDNEGEEEEEENEFV